MAKYVVIATSPVVDTSTVLGLYPSYAAANKAVVDVESKGYLTEVCEVERLDDLDESAPWDGMVPDEG